MSESTEQPFADVPTLAVLHPEWKAASDKLAELCAEEDALIEYGRLLQAECDASNLAAGRANLSLETRKPAAPAKPLSADVMERLGDLAPAPADPATSAVQPTVYTDELARRCVEYTSQLDAVRQAIVIVREKIRVEYRAGAHKLRTAIEPHYGVAASRVCAALVALADAWAQHEELRRHLVVNGSGVEYLRMLDPDPMNALVGSPRDGASPFRRFLSWANEIGCHDPKDIPERLSLPPPAADPIAPAVPPAKRLKRMGQRFVKMLSADETKDDAP